MSNSWVESSKRVIQQIDVGVDVDCTSQGETGLLATGQVGTTLCNLAGNAVRETFEVSSEGSSADGAFETSSIRGLAEGDVLLDGGGLNPWLLGAVSDRTIGNDL